MFSEFGWQRPTPLPIFLPMAKRSLVSMNNISVRRDGVSILNNISWDIESGQHWVVIGGNGSGKTSLLRVLMGYLTPTTGAVGMKDREDAISTEHQNWDEWRKRIGFVSSSLAQAIDEGETALEVVRSGKYAAINLWGQAEKTEIEEKAAKKALEKVSAEDLADRPWAVLSQGERQRVLIARALLTPKLDLLVLDEPCAGLDPVARETFLQFLETLTTKRTFKSLVLVTHHVEEIIPAITHALVLKDGEGVSQGEKRRALNSLSMSRAFDGDLKLRSRLGRYRLYFGDEFAPEGEVV